MERKAKIFSGTGSQYLSEKITRQFGNTPGKITIQHFSDGEIQPVFQESIRGDMVFFSSKHVLSCRKFAGTFIND